MNFQNWKCSSVKLLILSIAFLFFGLTGVATRAETPRSANCHLSAPPAEAGEEFIHGVTARIYPRARDIDRQYTGCQVLFLPDGEKWVALSMTVIVSGDPVRISALKEEGGRDFSDCRYENGKRTHGDEKVCPRVQSLIVKSMAPGCVEKIKKAVEDGGSSTQVTGCDYE